MMKLSLATALAMLAAFAGEVQVLAQDQKPVPPEPGQMPPLPPTLTAGIPAFPGAWGGGMFTIGGRGGKIIAVTSLDNSGPGTLRVAIDEQGPRVVVFRLAGIIR